MSWEYNYPKDSFLLVGRVGKPHGLRGEFRMACFSGQPENVLNYQTLVLVDQGGKLSSPLMVRASRVQGNGAVIGLDTITSREQAEKVVGLGVLVAKDELPEATGDEFYWHDYVDRQVLDPEHRVIGRVARLFSNGAQDILVVSTGKEEILIPITPDILVGEREGALVVDPPPGLLEVNKESTG